MKASKTQRTKSPNSRQSRSFIADRKRGRIFQQSGLSGRPFIAPISRQPDALTINRFPEEGEGHRRSGPPSYMESLDMTSGPSPIRFQINLSPPSGRPRPDYNSTESQLGAWERVRLTYTPLASFNTDTTSDGRPYVTSVAFGLQNQRYSYQIAQHIYQQSRSGNNRTTWLRVLSEIRGHSREHFNRFEETLRQFDSELSRHFAGLPGRHNPAAVSMELLDSHMESLLRHLHGRLNYLLWQTTCDWENTDYPRLFRGITNINVNLSPNCGPAPHVPPLPILPSTRSINTDGN